MKKLKTGDLLTATDPQHNHGPVTNPTCALFKPLLKKEQCYPTNSLPRAPDETLRFEIEQHTDGTRSK